jgi:hypothetical protein
MTFRQAFSVKSKESGEALASAMKDAGVSALEITGRSVFVNPVEGGFWMAWDVEVKDVATARRFIGELSEAVKNLEEYVAKAEGAED